MVFINSIYVPPGGAPNGGFYAIKSGFWIWFWSACVDVWGAGLCCVMCVLWIKGMVWDLELPLHHQHHPHCRRKNKSTFLISRQIGNTSANAGRHKITYINSSSQTISPFPTPHTPHCSPMHSHTHFAKSKSFITIS